ncbi:hypothetical protein B0I35DRAFT_497940 [Stachybotrys elegans]|uniref:Uncharacterized protein n=1 Tax=Stachybotrys elegans TaxID=80388 RepID=A0A8K0SBD8_9HYPO|nr:hypothetical protein B0I35DRAFT_497940 [Stachybotrys elegans]
MGKRAYLHSGRVLPRGHRETRCLSPEQMKLLGFNDCITDLPRHLPYLSADKTNDDYRWHVAGRGELQCYLGDSPMLELATSMAMPEDLYALDLVPVPRPDRRRGVVPWDAGCSTGGRGRSVRGRRD